MLNRNWWAINITVFDLWTWHNFLQNPKRNFIMVRVCTLKLCKEYQNLLLKFYINTCCSTIQIKGHLFLPILFKNRTSISVKLNSFIRHSIFKNTEIESNTSLVPKPKWMKRYRKKRWKMETKTTSLCFYIILRKEVETKDKMKKQQDTCK